MTLYNKIQPVLTITLFLLGALPLCPLPVYANDMVHYQLSLSFSPSKHLLSGTVRISVPAGQKINLSLTDLTVTGTLLKEPNGSERQLTIDSGVLKLPKSTGDRILFLSYTYDAQDSNTNLISPEAISLTNNWHPIPKEKGIFEVSARLPQGFLAIVESDQFPLTRKENIVTANYSIPTSSLHFNAAPYMVQKLHVRGKFFVYTMFFKEDQHLANDYLESAKSYLLRYEKEIGPFPYNHYVIVANQLPTGYGMPTFTLLGQMVLRLPFIKATSLGHEIVHSWFGNSVKVNTREGNWCEGLTTFLADYRSKELQAKGTQNRKEAITKYLSYNRESAKITLQEFQSASHSQKDADATRAVGYNRGALFFNELRQRLGIELFSKSIQHFYKNNAFKMASWTDLRKSFEIVSKTDLGDFFRQRLSRKYLPRLEVADIEFSYQDQVPQLNFTLLQQSELPFTIMVPIAVETMEGALQFTREITDKSTVISLPLESRPLSFTVDPDLSFLRELRDTALPPTWPRFLGAEKKLIIAADLKYKEKFQPLLNILDHYDYELVMADTVTNSALTNNSLLFLGTDQSAARSLFGHVQSPLNGFTLDSRINPLSPGEVAILASTSSLQQTKRVARKLKHYGKYSSLAFDNGRILTKATRQTPSDLHFVLESTPSGGNTQSTKTFSDIVGQLTKHRAIYVGENHTSLSDHLLQLRIIEALHKKDIPLAIGMEMFPTSSQTTLDEYTLSDGKMNQQEFLKASDYFDVWRYDYRYYRDILNFAKKRKIPVIGLNIERKIVSKVFKDGNTDGLSVPAKKALPADRDLDMAGYRERLQEIYSIHMGEAHINGAQSGFIQAQAIWDETMAENIANYLTTHPDRTMVVLAGSQHTRKDSGIPPRVSRRIPIPQASVLNLLNGSFPDNLPTIADYYFLGEPVELPLSPKIGIVLNTIKEEEQTKLQIEQLSPHSNAASAGLLPGDILLAVNEIPISGMADLKIAMIDSTKGDSIDLKIRRTENESTRIISFKVELSLPPALPLHP